MTEVVAIVVLHPPDRALSGDDTITAQTLQHFVPRPGDLDKVINWFRSAGFVVDAPGPISFSISAEPTVFESLFGDAEGPSFDLDGLPPSIRRLLAAVELADLPDFGPGNP